MRKLAEEKMPSLLLQIATIDLNDKLQLLAYLPNYLILRFLLLTLSMHLFTEKYIEQKPLLFSS